MSAGFKSRAHANVRGDLVDEAEGLWDGKSRAEHVKAHAKLVEARSPLADTYYAIHCVPTREQAMQRAATVTYAEEPTAGSTKPEGKRTAFEQHEHLKATRDPRAEVYGAIHHMAINASRPVEESAPPPPPRPGYEGVSPGEAAVVAGRGSQDERKVTIR